MAAAGRSRPGHTRAHRGKLVWVELTNGDAFTDRYGERSKGGRVSFLSGREVRQGDIKTLITSPKIIRKKQGE